MPPGFNRQDLCHRYDVLNFIEDDWHSYSGEKTLALVKRHLSAGKVNCRRLLNAGCGVYELKLHDWNEISLDIFVKPLINRPYGVCATIEQLPFGGHTFGAVTCVGEVLGYCDPAAAIKEFARVLYPEGILICDFASSRSVRHLLKNSYGRAAEVVIEDYNKTPEKTWAYDPKYISALLSAYGFRIKEKYGTHWWSVLAQRCGLGLAPSLRFQRAMDPLSFTRFADVMTIAAVKI